MRNDGQPWGGETSLQAITTPAPLARLEDRAPSIPLGAERLKDLEAGYALDQLTVLRRRKWSILLLTLAGGCAGLLLALLVAPVYQARTSIEALNLNEDFLNMKHSSPTTTSDPSYDTSELQTQIQILTSESLLARVRQNLAGHVFTPSQAVLEFSGLRSAFHKSGSIEVQEALVEDAFDSVKAHARSRTRIIDVSVLSQDPRLASDIANKLAENYIKRSVEQRWKTARETSEWLAVQVTEAREKLKGAESELQTYAKSSGLVFIDTDNKTSGDKLKQLQQELSTVTADRIARQSRDELARSSSPESLPDILNDQSLRALEAKRTDLRRQLADLTTIYTSQFAKVRRVQSELRAMETDLQQSRAAILSRIHNDYVEAQRREDLLSSAYKTQAGEVAADNDKLIQYNLLRTEVDGNRRLYDSLLQQLQQASVTSAMRASNARVVDQARVPDKPVSPNVKRSTALGLMAGLFSGLALALIRERRDRTLREPGDARLWTNLPELGHIPQVAFTPPQFSGGNAGELQRLDRWDERHAVTEAFRGVLASILFTSHDHRDQRVIGVTSAAPGDGKTTIVSRLATAMAQAGKRVLIIDADLCRPHLHTLFGLSNERGVSDYLQLDAQYGVRLHTWVQPTPIPGLDVLPSGPTTHETEDFLHSPAMSAVLAAARQDYEMVLVDCPPIHVTSARLIARLCDAVVLVIRADQTTGHAIMAVQQRLVEDGIPVIGTVLNRWRPNAATSSYNRESFNNISKYRSARAGTSGNKA